ncbi:hypothetical protein JCM10908_000074 [Rhodotorula pacifica]|uniref:RBR family RING finger protein n=1 Tax=Rhodotorula pacifica TaxID=1495444 RepID=UPI003175F359
MARAPPEELAQASLALLQQLFPTADPAFLRSCISHHLASTSSSSTRTESDATAKIAHVVQRVCDKLLELDHYSYWPAVRFWKYEDSDTEEEEDVELQRRRRDGGIATRDEVTRAFRDATATAKSASPAANTNAAAPAPTPNLKKRNRRRRVPDLTIERNLALIRLHRIFPLVPIPDLRDLILTSSSDGAGAGSEAGPYALWSGVETLLIRAEHEQRQRQRRRREAGGGLEPTRWWNASAGLFGLSAPGDSPSPAPGIQENDPVLTPHDLFHCRADLTYLVAHFGACFPTVPKREVERLVEREGGSYASLRQRLEALVLERAAGGGGGGGGGDEPGFGRKGGGAVVAKWWKRLITTEAPRSSGGSTLRRRSSSGTSTSPAQQLEEEEPVERHPFLEREIAAYERSLRGVPRTELASAQHSGPSTSTSQRQNPDDAVPDFFECQCCFATEPSSSSTRFFCEPACLDSSSSSAHQPHSFCQSCVRSLAKNYAYGDSSLSNDSLERFSLPCMAAATTTGDEPCSGMIARETLRRALDEELLIALERRMTETVLERFATASSASSAAARPDSTQQYRRPSSSGPHLVRCPLCPYAELADPTPGPLLATFCPAWVKEPFPPSAGDVFRSILGAVVLFPVLVLVLAVLVLVTPARRLERTYERVVAASHAGDSSVTTTAAATTTSSRLSLSDRILLEPFILPSIVLAHLAEVCERVRARRHGRRTVFRCRNVQAGASAGWGGKKGMSSRARWEVVSRMDAVDELAWCREEKDMGEEAEEGDPHIEERRRERLVRFIWGENALASDEQTRPTSSRSVPTICGRLSCLLCHAALNPSAPSLHSCRSPSSLDSTATDQERAEESLRLVVERAMSAAVVRECGRCGAGLTKKGGEGACNKITCRCGFAYCHACLRPISAWEGYTHFCPHPRDPLRPSSCPTPGCTKCSLWVEPDLAKRRREAAERARENWAEENPEWAEKVAKTKPLRAVGADLHVVPLYETTLDYYDSVVEYIARHLLA